MTAQIGTTQPVNSATISLAKVYTSYIAKNIERRASYVKKGKRASSSIYVSMYNVISYD